MDHISERPGAEDAGTVEFSIFSKIDDLTDIKSLHEKQAAHLARKFGLNASLAMTIAALAFAKHARRS